MAPEKVINQKGQAVLESLAVLILAGVMILTFMQQGLGSIHELALSEIMETRLLCELEDARQSKNHCADQMNFELKNLHFKIKSVVLLKNDVTIQLKLSGQLVQQFNLHRTLERHSFNEKF